MTERVRLLADGSFAGDESKETRDYGYPMFFRRGRQESDPDGRTLQNAHWTQAIDFAYHYLVTPTEDDIVEALLFSPTLIGKVSPIQFRIR